MSNTYEATNEPSTSIVAVPFRGDRIECVPGKSGPLVVVRRICESLDIDHDSQRKRLSDPKRSPWAGTVMMTVPSAGGPQKMFCIDLDSLPTWLATIDSSRVSEAARPKLIAYQREAATVLHD